MEPKINKKTIKNVFVFIRLDSIFSYSFDSDVRKCVDWLRLFWHNVFEAPFVSFHRSFLHENSNATLLYKILVLTQKMPNVTG